MNEIEQSRQLQRDCLKLHLIPPVLGILKIEKTNSQNKKTYKYESKSNSYVRNAYNTVANALLGLGAIPNTSIPNTYGAEGKANKQMGGSTTTVGLNGIYEILIGSNPTPDTIDDYTLTQITTGNSTVTLFDGIFIGNALTTTATRTFINTGATPLNVAETGIKTSSGNQLFLRDVFPTVTLYTGESITITYQLEMLYPS